MRGGSNIGKGQMKAADYVLVPDVVTKNSNSGGRNIAAWWGPAGRRGRRGGRRHQSQEQDRGCRADADRRPLNRTGRPGAGSLEEDRPRLGRRGGAFFGGSRRRVPAVTRNTEIGQVVTMAYLDAFTKLVSQVKGMTLNAKADNATQSVTMAKPGKMYEAANIKSKKVRDLDPGMTLYRAARKTACGGK